MSFYPVLFQSAGLMPGDLGDARFINYVLEHSYLYLKGVEIHSSFWDMPFFYPYKNTLAFSDILLGGMIIYIPIRFFTNSPETTLQIWLFVVYFLNFISFYFLSSKIFKFPTLISSLSAFLFTFSLPRHAQVYHLQLQLQFFTIFGLVCFLSLKKENSKFKNNILLLSASIMFVMQLYTSFYLGWYVVWGLFWIVIIFLFSKKLKEKMFNFLSFFKKEILIYLILSLILLIPLIKHYLAVGAAFLYEDENLLNLSFLFKSQSVLDIILNLHHDLFNCEIFIGIGYITTIFMISGLITSKYKNIIIAFLFFTSIFFLTDFTHKIIYFIFPGASAIRAVNRIIFLYLPIFIYLIGYYITQFKNLLFTCVAVFLILIEQIPYFHNFEWTKKEHRARLEKYTIPNECKIVSYKLKKKHISLFVLYNLDIMWIASNKNVYTTNGYSGYMPYKNNTNNLLGCVFEIKN